MLVANGVGASRDAETAHHSEEPVPLLYTAQVDYDAAQHTLL